MGLRHRLREWGSDLLRVIYPEVCHVCGQPLVRGEEVMCLTCRMGLPRTGLHQQAFSLLHQKVADPAVPISRAASYFYYSRDSKYSRLILHAKYNGFPRILQYLGKEYAAEIAPDGFFDGIDIVVPVPISPAKRRKRGYNQTEWLARGISDATGIPVACCLRARNHSTQTRLNAYNRWVNASDVYSLGCDPDEVRGKHVLLVDDIITTGATLLACARAITEAVSPVEISILTIACDHID